MRKLYACLSYCAFHKHANSKIQKPPSQLRFSLPSIISTITTNEPWNTETHKTDRNPPITNHDLLNTLKWSFVSQEVRKDDWRQRKTQSSVELAFELQNSHVCEKRSKRSHSFQYGTWIFLWSRQSGTDFSIFSILNIYLRTISSYYPYFTFLVKTGLGGCHFLLLVERGASKNSVWCGGIWKNFAPLKNIPFPLLPHPPLQYTLWMQPKYPLNGRVVAGMRQDEASASSGFKQDWIF